MKTLLIADKESTKNLFTLHLKPLGFDFIHYQNPIKAMDNVDEIEPDVVLFSAEDFPRHWKPFLKLLRATRTKEQTIFIILKGDRFSFDEAAKASHLGVNGIISEKFDQKEKNRLEVLFTRYSIIKDNRTDHRYIPEPYDNVEFIITHPGNYAIVTGSILDLSLEGIRFKPDNPTLTQDLGKGTILSACSLKVEDVIFTIKSKVVRQSDVLALQFLSFDEDVRDVILTFIDKKAERELYNLLHQSAV